jgi:hypothetical protein
VKTNSEDLVWAIVSFKVRELARELQLQIYLRFISVQQIKLQIQTRSLVTKCVGTYYFVRKLILRAGILSQA